MNRYGKDQCKHMDWTNKKVINAKDLAYCIYTHGLAIDKVPKERKELVQKEIAKLVKKKRKEKEKETNKESIKSVLVIYESDAIIHEFLESGTKIGKLPPDSPDTVAGYILDPGLFTNVESAKEALFLVESLAADIFNSIMENGARYKDETYNKDIESARKATIKLLKTYEKLGIPKSVTAKALKSIEREPNTTVKQELNSQRKKITNIFISLGNSATEAEKIAKAITLLSEKNILITSKF